MKIHHPDPQKALPFAEVAENPTCLVLSALAYTTGTAQPVICHKFGYPSQKLGGPKAKFRQDFGQLCNLIASMSKMQQDIIIQKNSL